MSDYIQSGSGFYQRLPAKSVYYPAPAAPEEQQPQQLGQLQQGGAALPAGTLPVVSNIETAPGVKLLSFHQEVTASIPPQLQQQLQQQQQALQQPRQQQAYGAPIGLVNSDYAAAGWGTQQYATPVRVINQQQQAAAGGLAEQPSVALQQAQSEYEQAMAMAQRAAERLGQLNGGLTPQVQYSGFGAQAAAAAPAQREQSSQVRFGGAQRIPTPTNSSYRFEDASRGKPAPAPKFNQGQAESVYIGMPNNLYFAANRPQEYHFAPQQAAPQLYRQPSNANLQTARENASNTNLRRILSEENVRTAILNDDAGNAIGFVQTRSAGAAPPPQAGGQQHQLQGGSSDYHFDALRGLNSAY